MKVREFYVLADKSPYNPSADSEITYRVKLNKNYGNLSQAEINECKEIKTLTFMVTHVGTWGDAIRVEGYGKTKIGPTANHEKNIKVVGNYHQPRDAGNRNDIKPSPFNVLIGTFAVSFWTPGNA
jgi:hypothetical protein